ncbi:hypothetical protein BSU04_15420 [Caballeronia sordidicola]|uniref:Uncharacterized protein n=1 Tax=Caballeronia sordidicola TaxID=196367 RepID=A0A226X2D5_CABSO|nr:hypothetical protein BSU04_15420 [Caballeronia sordidicola]
MRGNQTVIGVAGGVASLGERRLVLGLLQFEFHDPPLLVQGIHLHMLGLLGCFDCQGLHDTQKFVSDGSVDA